jgi:repressor LexA
MDNVQLTRKQREFFEYILDYKKDNDVWPTYREIAEKFDFKSPNSVTQNIKSLIKKGYLKKTTDEEYELATLGNRYINTSDRSIYDVDDDDATYGGIPIKGIITAGYLQEAVESNLGTINLNMLFPNLNRMYALRVSGMSMRDAGISDGDFVLLCDDDVKNGDIGAILFNGETSLKRVYYDKNGLRLEPANDSYSAIHVEPDVFEEVRVIGKYVGHVNKTGIYNNTRGIN